MSASAMLLSLKWRTVRSCALHPGCWRERMSAVCGGGEGGERSGYMWSTCATEQGQVSVT